PPPFPKYANRGGPNRFSFISSPVAVCGNGGGYRRGPADRQADMWTTSVRRATLGHEHKDEACLRQTRQDRRTAIPGGPHLAARHKRGVADNDSLAKGRRAEHRAAQVVRA